MKFIQAAGQQRREAERLEGLGQGYMSQLLKVQLTEFFTQAVPGTLTSWCRACAFLVGGWWVIQGTWQLGALIAFSTYLGMAVGPVQSLLGLYVAVQRMAVSLGRVMELKREPVAVQPAEAPLPIADGPANCAWRR
jgi:ATP-binding cassette subfamily B protein